MRTDENAKPLNDNNVNAKSNADEMWKHVTREKDVRVEQQDKDNDDVERPEEPYRV